MEDKELDEILEYAAEDMDSEEETELAAKAERQISKKTKRASDTVWYQSVLQYIHDLVYLIAIIVVVSLLLFRVVVVSGSSMYDTLVDGDYLLVLSNVLYRQPEQGDVVVASKQSFDNGTPIVKRVIATEGQTVDIDFAMGIVYVDGVALDEPYTYTATTNFEGIAFPLTVDDGCVFVMGDNRRDSKDSRDPEIGLIDEREILGKVIFLCLPGTHKGQIARDFSRIGVVS